ncbi:hypothetical protein [Marilutibacter maris]|uniref:hypothetical protein n=1 Tax=Marilutibacter maris TaxID=1605891 RepID=UPI000DA76271|nr:hypothetical protein [Lysobacter maris]
MRTSSLIASLLAATFALVAFAPPAAAQQVTFPNPLFVTTGTIGWSVTLDDSDPNRGVEYSLVLPRTSKSSGWLVLDYSGDAYELQSLPGKPAVTAKIAPIPQGGQCPYSRNAPNATYTIEFILRNVIYRGCGYFTQPQ